MLGEGHVNRRLLAILLVFVAVGLNLGSAILLKETADLGQASMLVIATLILLVVLINLLRVILWAAIHKRFRLSDSYPLTSLFFPMILLISAMYGEEIGLAKIVGTVLITLGVLVLMSGKVDEARADNSTLDI